MINSTLWIKQWEYDPYDYIDGCWAQVDQPGELLSPTVQVELGPQGIDCVSLWPGVVYTEFVQSLRPWERWSNCGCLLWLVTVIGD